MTREYTPTLFIDVGETGAFFTLRETYLHRTYIPGEGDMGNAVVNGVYQGTVIEEERSFHHQNLSQDADEAWAKAQALAQQMGLQLDGSREDLTEKMRDIHRATAEELERRAQIRAEQDAIWAAEREERAKARVQQVVDGIMPFGPHKGKKFDECPRGYLTWMAGKASEFEEGSIIRITAEALRDRFANLLLPTPSSTLHAGEIKQRKVWDVTVLRCAEFKRPMYGAPWRTERVYITTMIDKATGACLVVKSPNFGPVSEGEEMKIKATVVDHGDYKGQAQTLLQRVVDVTPAEMEAR